MEISKIKSMEGMEKSIPEHCTGEWEIVLHTEGEGVFSYHPENADTGRHEHAALQENMKAGRRADAVFTENIKAGRRVDFSENPVPETSIPFRAGDIFVIPPGYVFREESESGFCCRRLWLSNFRAVGRMGVKCFRDDPEGSVAGIFDLAERFDQNEAASAGAVVHSLGDVLYHILAVYYDQNQSKDLRLEGLLELMHTNIDNPEFDLAAAIRESGYSAGYFRRIFKEMAGEPPALYLQQLRIGRAKSLFQQYGKTRTVKEIALLSGYTDPLYFSRLFRKTEGMSPREYQEKVVARRNG